MKDSFLVQIYIKIEYFITHKRYFYYLLFNNNIKVWNYKKQKCKLFHSHLINLIKFFAILQKTRMVSFILFIFANNLSDVVVVYNLSSKHSDPYS